MIYAVETITVNTSIGFTASVLAEARKAHGRDVKCVRCTVEAAQIRAWEDGTAPTATTGHILNIGDVFIVNADNASRFRAIKTGATNGKISASFEV